MSSLIEFIIENIGEIWEQTLEHIWITMTAMIFAVTVGLLIGVLLTRFNKASGSVLGIVGIFQTIPSLALLGFMIPLLGIGFTPAIVALFLYALLPIVRNTYTGILKVDPSVKEAAKGMGMSDLQLLTKVELPLAIPMIFAGIRTAFVINVGVATLCALIAAGGLGEFIFRGISLNNINMILAGAIPAALLAVTVDFLLGKLQKSIRKVIKPVLIGALVLLVAVVSFLLVKPSLDKPFTGGFNSEFIHRADGYQGLKSVYELQIETVELEIGLMYKAIENRDVDVIGGFSTDGRIKAYNLRLLNDDKNYFPPYYAAPMVRGETLRRYPELKKTFELIANKISQEKMAEMNFEVDQNKRSPKEVAAAFLKTIGLKTSILRNKDADIIVGSKNFTESYILAEMFSILIENYTSLDAGLKLGFGGTKLNIDALTSGAIDLYPEYTGTALLVMIKPDEEIVREMIGDREKVYAFVKEKSKELFDFEWLQPLGFNNTHALLLREEEASKLGITSISELSKYLKDKD